jgi:hypothetical protein
MGWGTFSEADFGLNTIAMAVRFLALFSLRVERGAVVKQSLSWAV